MVKLRCSFYEVLGYGVELVWQVDEHGELLLNEYNEPSYVNIMPYPVYALERSSNMWEPSVYRHRHFETEKEAWQWLNIYMPSVLEYE